MIPKISVAMPGVRVHYAVPRILHSAGMLLNFHTDIYIGNKPWLHTLLKLTAKKFNKWPITSLLARNNPSIPPEKIRSTDTIGFRYMLDCHRTKGTQARSRLHADYAKTFNRAVIRAGLNGADAVFGFGAGSKELFVYAKEQGITCIQEQFIAPKQIEIALLREEIRLWPNWEPGLQIDNTPDIIQEREQAAWELADFIIGASDFVVDGLSECGISRDKCYVVPYGVDLNKYQTPIRNENHNTRSRLKVLFAGYVGLRKGAPYILEALANLGPQKVEARFAGGVGLSKDKISAFTDVAQFLGHVPRAEMQKLYQWADVFVLPSLCEGSATVIYEAIASGVPVIVTPNVGSVIKDQLGGWVIPIRDTETLTDKLRMLYEDRQLLDLARHQIPQLKETVSMENYSDQLLKAINDMFSDL